MCLCVCVCVSAHSFNHLFIFTQSLAETQPKTIIFSALGRQHHTDAFSSCASLHVCVCARACGCVFTQICTAAPHIRVKQATGRITCEQLSSPIRDSAQRPLMRRHARKLRSSVQHAQQTADCELQEEKGGFFLFFPPLFERSN